MDMLENAKDETLKRAAPSALIINDLVRASVASTRENLRRRREVYSGPIIEMPGSVFDDGTWENEKIQQALISDRPRKFRISGATLNDCTEEELHQLFFRLRLRPQDRLLVSIDFTDHESTLERAYGSAEVQQWFLLEFFTRFVRVGLSGLDYDKISVKVTYDKENNCVKFAICNEADQVLNYGTNGRYILKAGEYGGACVYKRPKEKMFDIFKRAGFETTHEMRACHPNPHVHMGYYEFGPTSVDNQKLKRISDRNSGCFL